MAKGFGCKVVYYDVKRNETFEMGSGAIFKPTVEDVLKEADFISLHVPLLDSTRHLINAERLAMMKPTSYLINTSRGPVVDEVALVNALKKGIIRGAGLDVFEFEPKLAKGLAKLPNVVLTPHIASARESARNEMARLAAQNIIDFFEGGVPANTVS
jgi:lactate dehydrogenase-like 2-hydroxyacid dehydrogenase